MVLTESSPSIERNPGRNCQSLLPLNVPQRTDDVQLEVFVNFVGDRSGGLNKAQHARRSPLEQLSSTENIPATWLLQLALLLIISQSVDMDVRRP